MLLAANDLMALKAVSHACYEGSRHERSTASGSQGQRASVDTASAVADRGTTGRGNAQTIEGDKQAFASSPMQQSTALILTISRCAAPAPPLCLFAHPEGASALTVQQSDASKPIGGGEPTVSLGHLQAFGHDVPDALHEATESESKYENKEFLHGNNIHGNEPLYSTPSTYTVTLGTLDDAATEDTLCCRAGHEFAELPLHARDVVQWASSNRTRCGSEIVTEVDGPLNACPRPPGVHVDPSPRQPQESFLQNSDLRGLLAASSKHLRIAQDLSGSCANWPCLSRVGLIEPVGLGQVHADLGSELPSAPIAQWSARNNSQLNNLADDQTACFREHLGAHSRASPCDAKSVQAALVFRQHWRKHMAQTLFGRMVHLYSLDRLQGATDTRIHEAVQQMEQTTRELRRRHGDLHDCSDSVLFSDAKAVLDAAADACTSIPITLRRAEQRTS